MKIVLEYRRAYNCLSQKQSSAEVLQNGVYQSFKSSCPEVFCKKGVLKNFAKFTGKHLCQSLFFNKVAGPEAWTLAQVFPVNFAKF